MGCFTSFVCVLSLKSSVYFALTAHLNSDVNFSSEIFGLYLDCTQFIAEKVHSQTQVIPNILNFSNHWSNYFQTYPN